MTSSPSFPSPSTIRNFFRPLRLQTSLGLAYCCIFPSKWTKNIRELSLWQNIHSWRFLFRMSWVVVATLLSGLSWVDVEGLSKSVSIGIGASWFCWGFFRRRTIFVMLHLFLQNKCHFAWLSQSVCSKSAPASTKVISIRFNGSANCTLLYALQAWCNLDHCFLFLNYQDK